MFGLDSIISCLSCQQVFYNFYSCLECNIVFVLQPPSMTRLESRNNEVNVSGGRGVGGGVRPPRGTNMRGMGRPSMDRPPMSRPSIDDSSRDFGKLNLN